MTCIGYVAVPEHRRLLPSYFSETHYSVPDIGMVSHQNTKIHRPVNQRWQSIKR